MDRFEYYTYCYNTEGFGGKVNTATLDTELNKLGNDGWELVSSTTTQTNGYSRTIVFVFKRKI